MFALRRYALPRRLQVVLGLALMWLVFAPGASSAAQLDTATATGSVGAGVSGFVNIDVNAHSGPAGENPGGSVSFGGSIEMHGQVIPVGAAGPVTCLNVTGNTAIMKFDVTISIFGNPVAVLGPAVVTLVDNGGAGLDLFGFSLSSAPTDCSASFAVPGAPLNGRAVVFDAPLLPTSKAQCENGGWRNYPQFKNQGDCVSFAETGK